MEHGTVEIMQIVTNDFGCVDTAIGSVQIYPETSLYVPNAFSPNDDKINDKFRPKGILVFDFNMKIYNRWGQLVFETNDLYYEWDGSYMNAGGGKKVDVYVYKIVYRDVLGNAHKKEGTVTILGTEELE